MGARRASNAASALVRLGVKHRLSRALFNAAYVRLPDERRRHVHHRYCKLFRDAGAGLAPGSWRVRFGGRDVRAPLRPERAWLDWELALSFTGHEQEIKRVYARMLAGPERPDLFVDVGANYGTHSILFLCHGVDTVTFEPNPDCHGYFRELCALNRVRGDLRPVALGDEERMVTIRYPERETWLGAVSAGDATSSGAATPPGGAAAKEVRVAQTRLDGYLERLRGERVLLKIDAEGSELPILRGSSALLRERAPAVIFESWPQAADRRALFELFAEQGYAVWDLAAGGDGRPGLTLDAFERSAADNFLARPGGG